MRHILTLLLVALTVASGAPSVASQGTAGDPLIDSVAADLDAYWSSAFHSGPRIYTSPFVTVVDQSVQTGCGRFLPGQVFAFYCVIDQTVYLDSQGLGVTATIGDFAIAFVVAHEWAHHIQFELGVDPGVALDRVDSPSWYALEQQADCLAGAYTLNAEAIGWLDPGDVEEAIFVTNAAGDPIGTPFDDPFAHGTGEDRVDAFLDGYDGSLAGCDLDL